MVNSTIVAKRWKKEIKSHSNWKMLEFREKVCTDENFHLSNRQAFRALAKAKSEIKGEAEDYFNKLWSYCLEIQRTNPGTTCCVKLSDLIEDGRRRFMRIYICWEACKKGFQHCRPIIGVDGCHLKGSTGGQLLTAVGIDGNDSIFPIAYAVVEGENKDSWIWFLELLNRDLGITAISEQEMTFISDKQKGLIPAFEVVLPSVMHRFCVRHLHANMKVAGFHGKLLKDVLWTAARSTTSVTYAYAIKPMAGVDEWPESNRQPPLPPLYKSRPGRPKKLRKRSAGELTKDGIGLSRKHVILHCSKCKKSGHNSRGCTKQSTQENIATVNEVQNAEYNMSLSAEEWPSLEALDAQRPTPEGLIP